MLKYLGPQNHLYLSVLLDSYYFNGFLHRETEAFESVAEDEQLPQVVDELQEVRVSPGSPIAKMQLRLKGEWIGPRLQHNTQELARLHWVLVTGGRLYC